MTDWTIRNAVPEDEPCLASMWLKGFAHSREHGIEDANRDGTPAEVRYWQVYQPIVTGLLRTAQVRVLCDPARSEYVDGRPAVIWAWACLAPGLAWWVGVKRAVKKADPELARDMVAELVGSDARTAMFDLVDLRGVRTPAGLGASLAPPGWTKDRTWLWTMAKLSAARLEADALTCRVARHITDPARAEWSPSKGVAA